MKRELYIVNNLIIKTLINIDIIKSKEIKLESINNIIIVIFYKGLKVSIISLS